MCLHFLSLLFDFALFSILFYSILLFCPIPSFPLFLLRQRAQMLCAWSLGVFLYTISPNRYMYVDLYRCGFVV